MKAAILAGGRGTRLWNSGNPAPKPLAEIGGRPILWHLMKYFDSFGIREFVIALGQSGPEVEAWIASLAESAEGRWSITPVQTGADTATGGRLKRLRPFLGDSTFFLSLADGLSDLDLEAFHVFHRCHGRLASVAAVHPPARFGYLELDGDRLARFAEKDRSAAGWINGGLFVLEPGVFGRIAGDSTRWEQDCLPGLAAAGQVAAFRHEGFWQCMDTESERRELDCAWQRGAPWKTWEDA